MSEKFARFVFHAQYYERSRDYWNQPIYSRQVNIMERHCVNASKLHPPFHNRYSRRRKPTLALLIAMVFLLLMFNSSAFASLCVVGTVKEVGSWVNPDQNTRGITRAVFGEECRNNSQTTCSGGICSTTSGVKLVYTAQLWGKCHPTDCYWGKVDGVYTSTNWLRFFYDHGFAKRTVWGRIWSGSDNWLRLIVDTDFVSPSRTDYRIDTWMRRQ